MFTLNPGRLTILRLRHITLLIYGPSCWWWYKNWWAGISGTRNWGLIPYTETSLPTNQVKSTESELHNVVIHTLDAVKHGEIAFKSFSTQWQGLWQILIWNYSIRCWMAWALVHNLLVGELHAGLHKNYSHTCRRNSGRVCGPGLLAGVYFMASAVEPHCGWTCKRTQWKWLLHTQVRWWYCYPNTWKNSEHHLKASSGDSGYDTTVMW